MKQTLKKIARWFLVALVAVLVVILAWEAVRPTVVSYIPDNTVVYNAPKAEPSEFEMWQKTEEVQTQLDLMYKKHKRDELTKEITDLESKR